MKMKQRIDPLSDRDLKALVLTNTVATQEERAYAFKILLERTYSLGWIAGKAEEQEKAEETYDHSDPRVWSGRASPTKR